MKKMNKKEIKITRAGYLYINGKKVTKRMITPLYIPREFGEDVEAKARAWTEKNYGFGQPRTSW